MAEPEVDHAEHLGSQVRRLGDQGLQAGGPKAEAEAEAEASTLPRNQDHNAQHGLLWPLTMRKEYPVQRLLQLGGHSGR